MMPPPPSKELATTGRAMPDMSAQLNIGGIVPEADGALGTGHKGPRLIDTAMR